MINSGNSSQGYFKQVWELVKKVPLGKVTTYGEIARKLGIKDVRIIGWALHANRDPKVPCHRVVNQFGKLARGFAHGGWRAQRKKLSEEGIKFNSQKKLNLQDFGFSF
jgi:methylated-DNA-protein-cysteine methyltransferase-like protein